MAAQEFVNGGNHQLRLIDPIHVSGPWHKKQAGIR
jgi:hypothetical protein